MQSDNYKTFRNNFQRNRCYWQIHIRMEHKRNFVLSSKKSINKILKLLRNSHTSNVLQNFWENNNQQHIQVLLARHMLFVLERHKLFV